MSLNKRGDGDENPDRVGANLAANVSMIPCSHRGNPVRVGPYTIFAGGIQYFMPDEDLLGYDVTISLVVVSEEAANYLAEHSEFRYKPLADFGGVSDGWRAFVRRVVLDLEREKRVLVFCMGSHGRTGTLLASLVALLEPDCDDPIAAIRKRHCPHAVETREQAAAVFALKAMPLPARYRKLQPSWEFVAGHD